MYSQKKWLEILECIDSNHAQQEIAKAIMKSNSGNESAEEWLSNVIGSYFKIVIHGDKTFLVKDDDDGNEYIEPMNSTIEVKLSTIFDRELYSEEEFFQVKDKILTIDESYEEEITDYISDYTGFLVNSFDYSVKFGEMDIYFR